MDTATDKRLEEAIAFHQEGDLDQAKTLYESCLAEEPDSPDVLYLLSLLLFQGDHIDGAKEHAENLVKAYPGNPDHHFLLADIHMTMEETGQAEVCYRAGLARDPDAEHGLLGLGSIRLMEGAWDEAMTLASKILAAKPLSGMGQTLMSEAGIGKAVAMDKSTEQGCAAAGGLFEKALAINPDSAPALGGLAETKARENDGDRVFVLLKALVNLDIPWEDKAQAVGPAGLQWLVENVIAEPDIHWGLLHGGIQFMRLTSFGRDMRLAEKYWKTVLKAAVEYLVGSNPSDDSNIRHRAEDFLHLLLPLGPDSRPAAGAAALTVLALASGRADEARSFAAEALAKDPEDGGVNLAIGLFEAFHGDPDKARSALSLWFLSEKPEVEFLRHLTVLPVPRPRLSSSLPDVILAALVEAIATWKKYILMTPWQMDLAEIFLAMPEDRAVEISERAWETFSGIYSLSQFDARACYAFFRHFKLPDKDAVQCAIMVSKGAAVWGDAHEGVSWGEKAVVGAPDDPEALMALALALQRVGKWKEAENHLRPLVEKFPDSPSALAMLGDCLHGQGRVEESRPWYREANRLAQNEPRTNVIHLRAEAAWEDFAADFRARRGIDAAPDGGLSLVHTHPGSSGGASIQWAFLKLIFPWRYFGGQHLLSREAMALMSEEVKSKFKYFYLHGPIPDYGTFNAEAPAKSLKFVTIRDPIRRAISYYGYFLSGHTDAILENKEPIDHDKILSAFMDRNRSGDFKANTWCRETIQAGRGMEISLPDDPEALYEQAKAVLEEDFDQVMVTDFFDACLFILTLYSGFEAVPMWPLLGKSHSRKPGQIRPEFIAELTEIHAADVRLHRYFMTKFEDEFAEEIKLVRDQLPSFETTISQRPGQNG